MNSQEQSTASLMRKITTLFMKSGGNVTFTCLWKSAAQSGESDTERIAG